MSLSKYCAELLVVVLSGVVFIKRSNVHAGLI